MPVDPPLRHRGFELVVRQDAAARALSFLVMHRGLALHASRADYRTPVSAERAARQFVDDALGAFGGAPAYHA